MASETTTKILEIQVNYEKAINGIADYEQQIRSARQAQTDLKAALKDGTITQEQYDKSMAASKAVVTQLKNEQAALTKQVRKSIEAEQAASGSLVEWRANLSNLTAEYDRMSIAERESAKGKELQTKINSLTTAIKAEEEATQRFYRNVGNYENGVRDALTNMNSNLTEAQRKYAQLAATMGEGSKEAQEAKSKMEGLQYVIDFTTESSKNMNNALYSFIPGGQLVAKLVPLMGTGFKGLSNGLKLAGQGFAMATKQAMAFIATPIGAMLAAIVAIISLFQAGMKGSEENMNRLTKLFAPFEKGLSLIQAVLQKVVGFMLSLAESIGFLATKFLEIINVATGGALDGFFKSAEEAISITEREQKLVKDKRDFEVEEAKQSLELAKLRKEANDTSNADTNARLEAAKKANEIERKLADERVRMATEEYELAKARAEWSDNSAEDNEELARLEAAKYKAEQEYYDHTMRLQKQQNELEKSIADERKQRNQEAVATAKERSKKEAEAIRQAEDAMIALLNDGADKQRKQINLSYDRQIADLKKRLDEEKNLTEKAREAINQTIEAKEQQRAQELEALDRSISDQEIKRQQEKIQLMLEAVKNGTDQEYRLKLQQIQLNLEADLAATETEIQNLEEREQMKALIRAKYAEQEDQLTLERQNTLREREQQAIQNEFEERLMEAESNSYEQAQIELERRQQELDSLHQMEGESNEAYRSRELAAQKAFNDAKKKVTQVEKQIDQSRLEVAKTVTGGIANAFAALGEENEAFAKMSKVLALGQIAIDTGKAIASGTAQAMSVPYPANLAAIAQTIATVLTNTATAISTVKSAKFAHGGKVERENYATGGKITGAGTGTSDSIPAWLSNGEFVMTAAATKIFQPQLEAMNAIGRGVVPPTSYQTVTIGGMNGNTLSDSLAASVSDIKPVVSVVDITEGINRVEAIDTLDTL